MLVLCIWMCAPPLPTVPMLRRSTAVRYGLASKDVTPAQLKAVFDNMKDESGKHLFTIGVNDDVTHLSLDVHEPLITESADTVSCKFWGLGGDGTVGANKNSARSSATTPTSTCRHTSSMTPRRPAA